MASTVVGSAASGPGEGGERLVCRHQHAANIGLARVLESTGLYVTRTELHELLGEAWDRAG